MKIVVLKQRGHNRDLFFCGSEELDVYLKKYALQDVKRNLTKVFVLEGKSPEEVVGYYTLSPLSFSKMEMTQPFSKKLPHYPTPAILLGRLAVSLNFQGQGIGAKLLMDALLRVHRVSEDCFGIYAVVVDAKNERARSFYQHFGFIPFLNKTNRLFLPLDVLKSLVCPLFPTLHEQAGEKIRHLG